jgi:hypothetical protein
MPCSFFVSIKGFGDLVIASRMVGMLRSDDGCSTTLPVPKLLVGEHLVELVRALRLERQVRFVATGDGYPAAFDFRRRGPLQALRSLLHLRRSLRGLPDDCRLIFDHLDWRESFIAAPYSCGELVAAPNVYLAFAETLSRLGYTLRPLANATASVFRTTGRLARIFPASRVPKKDIPAAVLTRLVKQLTQAGMRCEIIELAGENLRLPSDLPVRHTQRNFSSLIEAVSTSDLVVTADSLPGHLADYLDVRTYVMSPKENSYWLPLSCFTARGWSLFEDELALPAWLAEHAQRESA